MAPFKYNHILNMSKSPSREKEVVDDARKVFITNIDGTQLQGAVQFELHKLFDPFGAITKLNVKKNKNGHYSFAFLQFEKAECASTAIKELDQYELFGKRMRVRQDKQSQGCFHCKKSGHFARECPENKEGKNQPRPYHNNNNQRYNDKGNRQRYQRERDHYRDRDYNDRYHGDRRDRPYRDERDRREHEYRRRRSPSSRSRSYSRQHRHRRDYSSQSRSRSYERRYGHPSHGRRYHERDDRDRDRYRDEPQRRRRVSRSRSRSRSSGR